MLTVHLHARHEAVIFQVHRAVDIRSIPKVCLQNTNVFRTRDARWFYKGFECALQRVALAPLSLTYAPQDLNVLGFRQRSRSSGTRDDHRSCPRLLMVSFCMFRPFTIDDVVDSRVP